MTLAKLERATQMLIEAKSLDEVKHVIDIAEAAKTYAKAAKLGLDAQNHAAEIAILARRKAGEFLAQLERSKGGNPNLSNVGRVDSQYSETLQDAAISRQDANRWQQVAAVPEETFKDFIERTKADGKELTTAGVLRVAREINKENNPPLMPTDKYRVIYADPPWKYGNTMPDYFSEQADHYKLMTIKELCEMPINEIVENNAVLFLWVTSPILEESFQIINAWGFKYKSSFVWDKVKHNMGHYNSVRHEFLLVCVRGSCQPDVQRLFDSVHTEERTEHSKKPEHFRQVIDTIYPHGKRIELFAREKTEGWDVYGNEVK